MAEKFTILPSFVGQESNTAVLNDNGFADKLIEASRLKYAMDEAKHQAEQQKLAESIDFNSGDILQVDLDVINSKKDEYLKWLSDNAQSLAKNDLQTLAKQKEWKNKIDTQVDIAIGRKKQVGNQQTYLQTDAARNSGYGLQEDFDAVNNFANTPMGEWKGYNARDLYNELTYFKDYNIDTQKTVDDKGYTKTTINKTPSEDIISIADKKINSPEYNQLVGHYLKLSNGARNKTTLDVDVVYYDPEDFKKNGDMATPKVIKLSQITPDNIGSIVPYKKSALDEAYKNLKEEDKQVPTSPKSTDGDGNKGLVSYQQGVNVPIRGNIMSGGKSIGDKTLEIPADGWDLSSTANKPSNILIKAPTTAIPLAEGRYKELGVNSTEKIYGGVPIKIEIPDSWNVDVIGVYDVKVTATGKPILDRNSKVEGQTKRFALVKKDGRDFLIPYDERIKNPLQTAGIFLEEQTTQLNNTSTTTNTGGASKFNKK